MASLGTRKKVPINPSTKHSNGFKNDQSLVLQIPFQEAKKDPKILSKNTLRRKGVGALRE